MTGQIPATMRAAVLTGHGGPERLEVRDDVAVPTPGPGEALIRVVACGVNNTDINTRVGWYGRRDGNGIADSTWGDPTSMFPRIQGADPCGTVVAVGGAPDEGIRHDLVGRRVVVDPIIRDPADPSNRDTAGYLGSELDGGFAEYCVVPTVNVYEVPRTVDVSDIELAGLGCSWSAAHHMLDRAAVSAGHRVVVTGASGGVGSALVRLASLRGAEVTAIAATSKHVDVATLGAVHLVPRDADDVVATAVAAAGRAFDVVADVVGGTEVNRWLGSLRRGGRYVTAGAIGGAIAEIDLRVLYLNDLQLHGATVFEPRIFAELVALVTTGVVRPRVAATFPLGEIHAAQAAFERKQHAGKIVITI